MNRSDFLIRLLNYYAATNYKYQIVIGDSSTTMHIEQTKKAIKELGAKLKVKYHEFPGFSEPRCTSELVKLAETPYIAFVCDDDFLITNTLNKCLMFLEEHSDYSVALGMAALFNLNSSGPYGRISSVGEYKLRDIEKKTAQERILSHLSNYSNHNFGLHRTAEFRETYKAVVRLPDKSFTEILANSMSCIQGKVKKLPDLYLIRQVHDRRYLLPGLHDWFTSLDWSPSYRVFYDSLVDALSQTDGIRQEEARKVVKQGFWSYISQCLNKEFQQRYSSGYPRFCSDTKTFLKRIPGVFQAVQTIRSFSPNAVSLPALLRRQSPYHVDFMPIYRMVTTIPQNYTEGEKGVNLIKRD